MHSHRVLPSLSRPAIMKHTGEDVFPMASAQTFPSKNGSAMENAIRTMTPDDPDLFRVLEAHNIRYRVEVHNSWNYYVLS